jgi:hypothetical protein
MRCRVRHRTALNSALAVNMHIASSFVTTAENIDIRLWHHHGPAVTSAHIPHASRQDGHQRYPEPNFDSVNRTVYFVHEYLPFAGEIKTCGCSRFTIRRALIANRIIFSVWPTPQSW